MSGAALTFRVFGRPCVVVLPPTLDGIAPANDAHEAIEAGDDTDEGRDADQRPESSASSSSPASFFR
jgi:hypothetical protein